MKELILLFQNFEILLKHGGSLSPLEGDNLEILTRGLGKNCVWECILSKFLITIDKVYMKNLRIFFQRSLLVQECTKSLYQLLCKLSCMGIKIFWFQGTWTVCTTISGVKCINIGSINIGSIVTRGGFYSYLIKSILVMQTNSR